MFSGVGGNNLAILEEGLMDKTYMKISKKLTIITQYVNYTLYSVCKVSLQSVLLWLIYSYKSVHAISVSHMCKCL